MQNDKNFFMNFIYRIIKIDLSLSINKILDVLFFYENTSFQSYLHFHQLPVLTLYRTAAERLQVACNVLHCNCVNTHICIHLCK